MVHLIHIILIYNIFFVTLLYLQNRTEYYVKHPICIEYIQVYTGWFITDDIIKYMKKNKLKKKRKKSFQSTLENKF